MHGHMQRATALAQRAQREGGRAVAALIVRPGAAGGEDEVVAECVDGTHCPPDAAGGGTSRAGVLAAHPLQHAIMRCIAAVAEQQRLAEGAAAGAGSKRPGAPTHHLCTGCDAILTVEPCAMCAMALLHSRIRRVVYAAPAPADGALGSVYEVHAEPALNHHFQVLRGLARDDACSLLGVDSACGTGVCADHRADGDARDAEAPADAEAEAGAGAEASTS